jgi:hypothetical protein
MLHERGRKATNKRNQSTERGKARERERNNNKKLTRVFWNQVLLLFRELGERKLVRRAAGLPLFPPLGPMPPHSPDPPPFAHCSLSMILSPPRCRAPAAGTVARGQPGTKRTIRFSFTLDGGLAIDVFTLWSRQKRENGSLERAQTVSLSVRRRITSFMTAATSLSAAHLVLEKKMAFSCVQQWRPLTTCSAAIQNKKIFCQPQVTCRQPWQTS